MFIFLRDLIAIVFYKFSYISFWLFDFFRFFFYIFFIRFSKIIDYMVDNLYFFIIKTNVNIFKIFESIFCDKFRNSYIYMRKILSMFIYYYSL